MKKTCILLLIILMMTTFAFAEEASGIDYLLEPSDFTYRFVTHVNEETYVIYSQRNIINEEYYYLGKIKNGKLNEIGEIDEMIGGNNEALSYEVAGTMQNDNDFYAVTGLAHVKGEVYISKKTHLYRLNGDKLEEVKLIAKNGYHFRPAKINAVIDKMTNNKDNLYITLKPKDIYMTAESDSIFDHPLKGLVITVSPKGDISSTAIILPQIYPNINVNFAVSDDEKIIYNASYKVLREFKANDTKYQVDYIDSKGNLAIFPNGLVEERYSNVLYKGKDILAYKPRPYNQSINVKRVNVLATTKSRLRPGLVVKTCSTTDAIVVEKAQFIIHWSIGDDGAIYAIVKNAAAIDVRRFKL